MGYTNRIAAQSGRFQPLSPDRPSRLTQIDFTRINSKSVNRASLSTETSREFERFAAVKLENSHRVLGLLGANRDSQPAPVNRRNSGAHWTYRPQTQPTKKRRLFTSGASKFAVQKRSGSPSKTRTCDKPVNSRLLYQLSYRGTLAATVAIGMAQSRGSWVCFGRRCGSL